MGGSHSSVPSDVHVVIVGAGFAGTALGLKLLSCSANFTLIDPKDVFHQNTASTRSCVEPGTEVINDLFLQISFYCSYLESRKLVRTDIHSDNSGNFRILA